MKRRLIHILTVLFSAVAMFSACSSDRGQVIPRGTLAEIYAEMLMVDQWIALTPSARKIADTTYVYTPILERYGYTADDYRMSMDKYMHDPERYSRILRKTSEILGKRLEVLRAEQDRLARIAAIPVFKVEFDAESFAPYLKDAKIMYHDSISFEPDSATWSYRLTAHELADTVYDGLVMVVRSDSLVTADSLAVADSLAAADSVATASAAEVADTMVSAIFRHEIKELKLAEDTLLNKKKPMRSISQKKVKVERLKTSEDKK